MPFSQLSLLTFTSEPDPSFASHQNPLPILSQPIPPSVPSTFYKTVSLSLGSAGNLLSLPPTPTLMTSVSGCATCPPKLPCTQKHLLLKIWWISKGKIVPVKQRDKIKNARFFPLSTKWANSKQVCFASEADHKTDQSTPRISAIVRIISE